LSHEAPGESNEWYTPAHVFEALGEVFDLDVACPTEGPRYVPARRFFSEGALEREWSGFVWMNPPFGHQSTKVTWLTKFFDHGNGIALLPDRTSADWWQDLVPRSSCILFTKDKIKFERPDGSIGKQPGTGTTLFAAGDRARSALLRASSLGQVFQHISANAA